MSGQTYSAPALEKGLEIIEFLSGHDAALSIADICAGVARSKAEIYRMLLTLESKDYIRRDPQGRYALTGRLFDLGMRHPPRRNLIETALPHMRALARLAEQSCHMTILSRDQIVAIARAESEGMITFGVKVGFRAPALTATSGRLLFPFQDLKAQLATCRAMQVQAHRPAFKAFMADARQARAQGYLMRDSTYTLGITDLAAPIFQGHARRAVAGLIVPFTTHAVCHMEKADVLTLLRDTAQAISAEL
ncbi:MAG: IclR family transcriptional regulator [Asticcacaulis sp.]